MEERYRKVTVIYPEDVSAAEIKGTVDSIINEWPKEHGSKVLGSIVVELDGDEFVFRSFEKSPIVRTRRITGYLSNLDNFGDHKKAEEKDRVAHV